MLMTVDCLLGYRVIYQRLWIAGKRINFNLAVNSFESRFKCKDNRIVPNRAPFVPPR